LRRYIGAFLYFLLMGLTTSAWSQEKADLNVQTRNKLANHYLKTHPTSRWEYDWTTAVFLYGALRSNDRKPLPGFQKDEVKSIFDGFQKNKIPEVTMPDVAAISLPAAHWLSKNLSEKPASVLQVVQATKKYFQTEPLNSLGMYDHVGKRHHFAWWLPPTHWFVPSSVWIDSVVMYVLNGYLIAEIESDSKSKDFFIEQFLKVHELLWDPSAQLYKHAYYIRSKAFAPKKSYWARGNAWMILATVDLLELLPKKDSRYSQVLQIFKAQINGLEKHLDLQQGLKTLITDSGSDNYYESSSSALVAYAMLKGERLGFLGSGSRAKALVLSKALMMNLKIVNSNEVSLSQISAPTSAIPWDWYYKNLVGLVSDESYGVGAYLLMMGEAI
jgi:rhamnogalacturonyl hydrolase YesR